MGAVFAVLTDVAVSAVVGIGTEDIGGVGEDEDLGEDGEDAFEDEDDNEDNSTSCSLNTTAVFVRFRGEHGFTSTGRDLDFADLFSAVNPVDFDSF